MQFFSASQTPDPGSDGPPGGDRPGAVGGDGYRRHHIRMTGQYLQSRWVVMNGGPLRDELPGWHGEQALTGPAIRRVRTDTQKPAGLDGRFEEERRFQYRQNKEMRQTIVRVNVTHLQKKVSAFLVLQRFRLHRVQSRRA